MTNDFSNSQELCGWREDANDDESITLKIPWIMDWNWNCGFCFINKLKNKKTLNESIFSAFLGKLCINRQVYFFGFSFFFVVFYSRNIEYLQLVDNSLAILFIYNQFNNCNDLWPRFFRTNPMTCLCFIFMYMDMDGIYLWRCFFLLV